MGIEQRYSCDLCGAEVLREQLRALILLRLDQRREDGDKVFIGDCCLNRPIGDAVAERDRAVAAGEMVTVE